MEKKRKGKRVKNPSGSVQGSPPPRPAPRVIAKSRKWTIRVRRRRFEDFSAAEKGLWKFDRLSAKYARWDPVIARINIRASLEERPGAWVGDRPSLESVLALTLDIQSWLVRAAPHDERVVRLLKQLRKELHGLPDERNEILEVLDSCSGNALRFRRHLVEIRGSGALRVTDETIQTLIARWFPADVDRRKRPTAKWKSVVPLLRELGLPIVAPDTIEREWRKYRNAMNDDQKSETGERKPPGG